jgi:hypothetical protein
MEVNRRLLSQGDLTLPRKILDVPEMRALFSGLLDGQIPTLLIRALTGREMFLAGEAATQNQLRSKLVEGLQAAANDAKAGEALAKLLTDQERDPDEFRRRLVIFRCGVIAEDGTALFDELETARIAELWGGSFATVTLEIMALSQEGPKVGE